MKIRIVLTSLDVAGIISACKARSKELSRVATIAVVDDTGMLLYLERPDVITPVSVEVAVMKARTSFLYSRPTSALEKRVDERSAFLTMPNLIAVSGGLPLMVDGNCIGGVGVGGADKDDELIAMAGAEFAAKLTLEAD